MSLRPLWLYLTLKVIPLALLLFVINSVAQFYMASRLESNIAASRLQQDTELYAKSIKQHLDGLVSQVKSISNNSIIVNSMIDFTGRQNYLPTYIETVGIFGRTDIAVQLVDFSGEEIDGNFYGKTAIFPAPDLWSEQVLEEGLQWVQLNHQGLFIAQPVLSQGLPEGAILVQVSLDILAQEFEVIHAGYNRLLLTDKGDLIFASAESDFKADAGTFHDSNLWLRSNLESIENYGITAHIYLAKETLVLSANLFLPIISLSLIIFVLSIVLVVFLSATQLKQIIFSLSAAIENTISSKDLQARVENEDSPLELAKLGSHFNQMMTQLQSTTSTLDEVEAILNSMAERVLVCDRDLLVLLNNKLDNTNDSNIKKLAQVVDLPASHSFCQNTSETVKYEQKHHDKTILWHKVPLVLQGIVNGWVITGSDISEIKHAQQQANILSMAMDSASNGIIIVDASKASKPIMFVNQSFSEITGYSEEDVLGLSCDFLQGDETAADTRRRLSLAIKQHKSIDVEIVNYRKNGELFWNHLAIDPIIDENNLVTHYLGVIRDITSVVKAQSDLEIAKEAAESAAVAKSEFLATMSHEIRTPMNGVIGMLGLLLNTKLDSDQAHRARIAQGSAQSLLILINDILDFSKIEAGKLDLESIDFNLREMLGEFAEGMAYLAHDKGLELILDVSGISASMVCGDPGRIRQILNNLVSNAVKFTSDGEVIIQLSLLDVDGRWQVNGQIKDSGMGIPADKIPLLFEAFTQVDASTTRRFGGTGLGLVIVRRLCQVMGGDIRVTSELGQGSNFEFDFFIDQSTKSQLVRPTVDVSKLHILIVDDNKTNLDVLRSQLKIWGVSVTEAIDGQQALTICKERLEQKDLPMFDIGILDMQMPNMDGIELGSLMKSDKQLAGIKLVMMTSMTYQGDIQELAQVGFSAYFPKPATTSDLFKAINVVAEDGIALASARTLVTGEYLESLQQPNESKNEIIFPADTRILLVDDNQINLLVAEGLLEDFDITIECAGNGIEALSFLNNTPEDYPYSLVVMDCQMPEMDGFEATRQIRAGKAGDRYQDIPIIAMTANAMQGDRDKCIAAGMSDYLAKPIEPNLFYEKLVQWLK
jgi:PAS domain S-box-containing protein